METINDRIAKHRMFMQEYKKLSTEERNSEFGKSLLASCRNIAIELEDIKSGLMVNRLRHPLDLLCQGLRVFYETFERLIEPNKE